MYGIRTRYEISSQELYAGRFVGSMETNSTFADITISIIAKINLNGSLKVKYEKQSSTPLNLFNKIKENY